MFRKIWRVWTYLALVVFLLVLAGIGWMVYRLQTPTVTYALPPVEATSTFGGATLDLGFATTTAAQKLGLGGLPTIPSHYGLLFVFGSDGYYGFWMKNMRFPIDIFWLNAQGRVVSLLQDVQPNTYPNVFYPASASRYVLETRAGFAQVYHIATSTPLQLPKSVTVLR